MAAEEKLSEHLAEEEASADDEQRRRIFLRIRRHQLLAPVNAIIELTTELTSEDKIQANETFCKDLGVIQETTARLSAMISGLMKEQDVTPSREQLRKVNHDLRGLLTIVLGYSEELIRTASREFLTAFSEELHQIEQQGRHLLKLLDEVVAFLKGDQEAGKLSSEMRVLTEELLQIDEEEEATVPGRLLVVDDDEAIRLTLERRLKGNGHDVTCVGDGSSALSLLQSPDSNFDLVLLDIVMPELNGFQVLQEVKMNPDLRNVPVIVISGLGEVDDAVHCIRLGAEDYLTKPFNRVLLRARIGACLEKKRLRDQNEMQRKRYDTLLRDILPPPIVDQLAVQDRVPPQRHEGVAVLFADIVGFTSRCDHHPPEDVVGDLEYLFVAWEEIAVACGVQKIKTIGDAFMAVSGVLQPSENPVLDCVRCGQRMIKATQEHRGGWNLRVGVHVGPVVAGVLGRRQYLYDLWGDTVNTAARMESNGLAGHVNLTADAWAMVTSHFSLEPQRTAKTIKGKGMIDLIHLPS